MKFCDPFLDLVAQQAKVNVPDGAGLLVILAVPDGRCAISRVNMPVQDALRFLELARQQVTAQLPPSGGSSSGPPSEPPPTPPIKSVH